MNTLKTKMFNVLILAAAFVALTNQVQAQTPGAGSPREPELYMASSGDQVVKDAEGSRVVSVDVTTIAPSNADEGSDFDAATIAQLNALDAASPEETRLFIAEPGGAREVSRNVFLRYLKWTKESFTSEYAKDRSFPFTVAMRGFLNFDMTMKGLMLANHFPHHPALIGGLTAGAMSTTLALYTGPYARWVNKNKRPDVIFAKSFITSFPYLLVVNAAVAAAGSPIEPTVLSNIVAAGRTAAIGSLILSSVGPAIFQISNNMTAKYPKREKLIHIGRNLAFLANSGYSAVVTAMELQGLPHANFLYAAVGVPAWIYMGYKNDWLPKITESMNKAKTRIDLQTSKIALPAALIAARVYDRFLDLIGVVAEAEPAAVPADVQKDAAKKKKETNKAFCRIDLS